MPIIYLTRNKEAIVDEVDYQYLSQFRWTFQPGKTEVCDGYAVRWVWRQDRGAVPWREKVYMHRDITNAPRGLSVDHFPDPCGLNNQRNNLRIVTTLENNVTRISWRGEDLHLRGVSAYLNRSGEWRYRSRYGDTHLGVFADPISAGRAYDFHVTAIFGPYVYTNFPKPVVELVRKRVGKPTVEEIPW